MRRPVWFWRSSSTWQYVALVIAGLRKAQERVAMGAGRRVRPWRPGHTTYGMQRCRSGSALASPPTVARRAGHSVDGLLRIYANCIDGDDEIANQHITGALR